MVGNWLFEWNLRPFLEITAQRAGAELGEDDWNAIRFMLSETDHERNRWSEYEFSGTHRCKLRLAVEPGSSVVFVEVQSDAVVEDALSIVMEIVQEYRLSK